LPNIVITDINFPIILFQSMKFFPLNVLRPAGIPVVPVYEEDEPSARRKVQRITSPEKWEIKQVNTA